MDDSLSFESFYEGASRAAQKAMEDHGRGEYDEFALHAGVAVERLAKAVLVMRNPLYLVEMRNGNADLLLYFGGDLELDTTKVRTVGAKEAIQRLRRMGILPPDSKLDLLIELRNGTAHTTVGDEAKTLLPTLAQTVAVLLTATATAFRVFWGRWARTVIVAVDKQLDEIRRDVEIRIDQSRHRFEDKFSGMPDATKERVLSTPTPEHGKYWLGDMTVLNGSDVLLISSRVACPACTGTAMMTLVPTDRTGPRTDFAPDGFICHLCGLNLRGREEMAACGKLADLDGTVVSIPPFSDAHAMRSDVRLGETCEG
ncbi:hypothetical protein [Streptomyces milbemycinicus]|uniref:hypothetical protein n=1 Tax=Streptomyces milbemycinicus TaxID=476552 RepID=UPI0033C04EEA